MNEQEYDTLLENAWKKIPEGFHETERWRIPTVRIGYEGRTTIVRNIQQILTDLGRDEKHVMSYLLNELGTAGDIKGQNAFFKGRQKESVMNKQLELYAKKFVICPACQKPDTKLIKENRSLILHCAACGVDTTLK